MLGRLRHWAPSQISLREKPVGGQRKHAEATPPELIANSDDILLLIHGFAVNETDANARYAEFRASLDGDWNRRAANLHWPGDVGTRAALAAGKSGLGSRILSATAYSLQVKPAEDSARRLMRFIVPEITKRRTALASAAKPPKMFQLRIVAHSLGCLVTLELLKALESTFLSKDLEVPLAVLMAAAVPQYRMRDEDFGEVVKKLGRVIVYHSYRDWVLAAAFPAGQALQWQFPYGLVRRGAVGRHGCGYRFGNVEERRGKQGHGDYWRDPAIGRQISDELTGRGPATSGARTIIPREGRPRTTSGRFFKPWR